MFLVRRFRVRKGERGFLFRDREFVRALGPGVTWIFDPFGRARVDVSAQRDVFVRHAELDVLVRAKAFGEEALVLDLADRQRALVRVDGRTAAVLGPGLHVLWTGERRVETEVLDARALRLEREELAPVLAAPGAREALEAVTVEAGHVGLLFRDGRHEATLAPGTYAFWKGVGTLRVKPVDLREQALDVTGQEILTADKVTLRMNAVVAFRVADPLASVTASEDARQALYREAQLALRAVVGTRELDALLADKDGVAGALASLVRARAAGLGLAVTALGIRDVILPGEMKELLNRVTEAKKAAEAALITRREETAAMRSQANTAKVLEGNPALLRLRELETLERVAGKARLNVVLGERGGLLESVVKLV